MNETRLRIIEVLKQYSDENHRLTQNSICEIYAREYGASIDRKTVGRHLSNLIDQEYPLVYKDQASDKDKRVITDIYWENEFTNSELRLLIDLISFSRNIPINNAKELTDKLKNIGSSYLRKSITNIYSVEELHEDASSELFLNIEIITEAMEQNHKISFLTKRFNEEGNLISKGLTKVANPYKLIAHNHIYYLLCNIQEEEGLECIRVDKMTQVEILPCERITPINKVDATFRDIGEYIKAHPLMNSGDPERAKIKISRNAIDDLYDTFGSSIKIKREQGSRNYYIAEVRASFKDILVWVLMQGKNAEVIEPEQLRDKLHEIVFGLYRHYSKDYMNPYETALERAEETGRLHLSMDLSELDTRYKALTKCKEVILRKNNISDFEFLTDFSELIRLTIEHNTIKDIGFLSRVENLYSVELRHVDSSDWGRIKECRSIRQLTITGCNIDDYSFINELRDLSYLAIDYAALKDIDMELFLKNNPHAELALSNQNYRQMLK